MLLLFKKDIYTHFHFEAHIWVTQSIGKASVRVLERVKTQCYLKWTWFPCWGWSNLICQCWTLLCHRELSGRESKTEADGFSNRRVFLPPPFLLLFPTSVLPPTNPIASCPIPPHHFEYFYHNCWSNSVSFLNAFCLMMNYCTTVHRYVSCENSGQVWQIISPPIFKNKFTKFWRMM